MKKFIKIIFVTTICLLLVTLAACGRNEETAENAPHQGMVIDPGAPGQPVELIPVPPEEYRDIEWPISGFYFTLTDEEQAVYERFLAELSTDVFEGLSPISVAKISIEAGINGEWEAEFYSFSQDGLERTKDEWRQMHERDIVMFDIYTRRIQANWMFPFIDYAVVLERGNMATLVFHAAPDPEVEPEFHFVDTITAFSLIRNDRGIWEVLFRPTSISDELMTELEGMAPELTQAWYELVERIGL
ncbi:MAG: phage portal protein [Defluviitaleaceae bacterium]|nr:phage portal protein [Defluviitaleaceae bacterium]